MLEISKNQDISMPTTKK